MKFASISAPDLSSDRYLGSELDLFRGASHWRRYWTQMIAHLTTGSVLEVGAGLGSVTVLLGPRARQWTALEPDGALLAAIPEAYRRLCGRLEALPEGEQFDAVLYADVLEHIEADQQELDAAYQRLKPGGSLIVLAPAHAWLYSPFDRAIGHYRRYNRRSLQAISPRGSETVTTRYLDCLGMALSAANRLLLRASMPTAAQIRIWDRWIVPCSRWLDPLLGYRIGKSILIIWQKPQPAAAAPAPAPGLPDPCR
jgi:SAM-dependent methyltransferase